MSDETTESLIKWSVSRACIEFGSTYQTLVKRLNERAEQADSGGRYTTRQICSALYGDIQEERLRKTKEEADQLGLENAKKRGLLIPVADAAELNRRVAFAIRQKIVASSLPPDRVNAILLDIQRLAEVDFTKEGAVDEGDPGA